MAAAASLLAIKARRPSTMRRPPTGTARGAVLQRRCASSSALVLLLLLTSALPRPASGRRRHDGNAALESIARGDGHTLFQQPLNNAGGGDYYDYGGKSHNREYRNRGSGEGPAHRSDDDEDRSLAAAAVVPFPTQRPNGDPSCPCLSTIEELSSLDADADANRLTNLLGPHVNATAHGLGCAPHDVHTEPCLNIDECANKVPLPVDCDRGWCMRSWCYVDPNDCAVHHRPSMIAEFEGLDYSYATCGHMDVYTTADRLHNLKGQTLRVAYNANSGGWRGAYNPAGSFAINSAWRGPIVEFVRQAALVGEFGIEVVRPPEWLREESQRFFGSSSFDYCVYAASLGYVDLCVAAYTITDKRAGVATFFETSAAPVYVITMQEEIEGWEKVKTSVALIFRPFAWSAWAFMFIFCLPILGLIMLWHENGRPGSAYPSRVPVLVTDNDTGERAETTQRVPMSKHVVTSLYMSILAFFQESYDQSVVTLGGKAHLLGVSSFIMLILAVYTANLAAILTQDYQTPVIESFDAAVAAGYNFCAERKVMEVVLNNLGHDVDPTKLFVPDPVDLGGDGAPGFNCPNCRARTRVFDMMRSAHSDPTRYCHAAIALQEDLEVLQSNGEHCGKVVVGDVLALSSTGVPIATHKSEALISLFHKMKNEGVLFKEASDARPASTCPAEAEEQEEGTALTIEQLAGIWVVVFSFVLIGALLKLCNFVGKKKSAHKSGRSVRLLQRYDQWGNPTDTELDANDKEADEREELLLSQRKEVIVVEQEVSSGSENSFREGTGKSLGTGEVVPENGGLWSWFTRG